MNNLDKFLKEVKKEDYLNLFLNSLIDDYCEEFKILFNYNKSLNEINKNNTNTKTNKICIAIRKLLLTDKNKESGDYLSTILITYIKQNPHLYLEALKLVQKLKIENKTEKADKALEFLCWMVKADTLFDFALITYDFELVIMVAKHTQKDPKEYLKYLNELEEIKKVDPIKMKYKINMDQKNYSGALKELSKGGEKYFNEALNLIQKYNLYDEGLALFNAPLYENLYAQIYEKKADYLNNLPSNDPNKNDNLAAMCYFRCRNYKKAFKLFCSLGKVNEALILLNEINKNELEKDLFTILIELLEVIKEKAAKNEIEKYYLYLTDNKVWTILSPNEFNDIINKLIEIMTDNKLYNLSYFATISILRQVQSDEKIYNLLSNLPKLLNDNLSLQYDLNSNLLKKNLTLFKEKYNRFLIVQEIKKEHPEIYELDINKEEEFDNVSDSGSILSGSSKKSGKSSASKMSKSKKKKKNKKRNVKEGSPMEEEFLLEILKELKIEDNYVKDMNELCDVLLMSKMNEKSEELKKLVKDYVIEVNGKVNKLFLYKQIKYVNEHPELCELFPNFELNSILFNENEKDVNVINIKKENK
jgi:elongator complex protein 1